MSVIGGRLWVSDCIHAWSLREIEQSEGGPLGGAGPGSEVPFASAVRRACPIALLVDGRDAYHGRQWCSLILFGGIVLERDGMTCGRPEPIRGGVPNWAERYPRENLTGSPKP